MQARALELVIFLLERESVDNMIAASLLTEADG